MIEINDQRYGHIYKFHLISIEEICVLWMSVPGYFFLLKKPQKTDWSLGLYSGQLIIAY